ncbi:hypothetical protein PGIGA_G00133880 [Pangasianodon gigas]|uniref:Uncharacterized protein n=1 Tax=Pangasianodon gigas TaxID=30993 RepID=A0ACC5XJY6_PANGG|nr:hypothetical protein [Pangasianodon gigas]
MMTQFSFLCECTTGCCKSTLIMVRPLSVDAWYLHRHDTKEIQTLEFWFKMCTVTHKPSDLKEVCHTLMMVAASQQQGP